MSQSRRCSEIAVLIAVHCYLHISRRVISFHVSLSFVLKNGRISGIVARAVVYMPSIPSCGYRSTTKILSRREAFVIHRLRLGHCCLTHSYLMSGDDQPVCESCRLADSWAYIISRLSGLQSYKTLDWSILYTVSSLNASTIATSLILSKKLILPCDCM